MHQGTMFRVRPKSIHELLSDGARFRQLAGRRGRGGTSEGAWFSLFDDQLEGRQTELVRDELVDHAWRMADWKSGNYSIVRFTLTPEAGGTRLVARASGASTSLEESDI